MVVHVSGEKHADEIGVDNGPECLERVGQEVQGENGSIEVEGDCDHEEGAGDRCRTGKRGRWEPSFLRAQLRETCLRQLEIPVKKTVKRFATARCIIIVRRHISMNCAKHGVPVFQTLSRSGDASCFVFLLTTVRVYDTYYSTVFTTGNSASCQGAILSQARSLFRRSHAGRDTSLRH